MQGPITIPPRHGPLQPWLIPQLFRDQRRAGVGAALGAAGGIACCGPYAKGTSSRYGRGSAAGSSVPSTSKFNLASAASVQTPILPPLGCRPLLVVVPPVQPAHRPRLIPVRERLQLQALIPQAPVETLVAVRVRRDCWDTRQSGIVTMVSSA
jgi:hypothetical protein